MNKKSKIKMSVLCILLVVTISTAGLFIWKFTRTPTEVFYISSDTDVNLADPREVVGVKEYVFVAKVEETHDYYKEKLIRSFPGIIDYYDREFTECVVTVIANIKGELQEGKTFSFYKTGGIAWDRSCIVLSSKSDLIPEAGKYYIFSGKAHADGTMTGGGANGTFELEEGITENNLDESKIYQQYVDAFNNQILPKNKGFYPDFLCTADKKFGDGSYNAELYTEYRKKKEEINKKYAEKQSMSYEEYQKKHPDEYDKAVRKGSNPKIK